MPAGKLREVVSVVLKGALYFFTPSTHNCVLTIVPVIFEAAATCTGDVTEEPGAGRQRFTPGELGALQAPPLEMVAFTALSHF